MKLKVTVNLELNLPNANMTEDALAQFTEDEANKFTESKSNLIKVFKEDWDSVEIINFEFTSKEVIYN